MRRLLTLILIVVALVAGGTGVHAQAPVPAPQTQPKEQTVYVTKTGKKYHRDGCRYLRSSRIPVVLKDAKANGYTPCSVCRPAQ
jgi:hypothetical protein